MALAVARLAKLFRCVGAQIHHLHFAQVKTILDKEAPLEDLPSALSDMVSCLAEIAHETKGYDLPELNEPEEGEEKA